MRLGRGGLSTARPRGRLTALGFAQRCVRRAARLVGLEQAVVRSLLDYRLSTVGVAVAGAGVRILHLSDLHADGIPDGCEALCRALHSILADVCVITGDFVDPSVEDLAQVELRLRKIVDAIRCPSGIFAVLGNHDPPEVSCLLSRCGVDLLGIMEVHVECATGAVVRLASEAVDGFRPSKSLLQLSHYAAEYRVQRMLSESAPLVFVAHSPDSREEALARHADYYLCGHTHGGQVCLPGGYPIVTKCASGREFGSGSWQYKQLRGYTSRGIGVCGQSPRVCCPPEIALHILAARAS